MYVLIRVDCVRSYSLALRTRSYSLALRLYEITTKGNSIIRTKSSSGVNFGKKIMLMSPSWGRG